MRKEIWALITFVVGIIVYYAMVIYYILKKRRYIIMFRSKNGSYKGKIKKERA